MKMTIRDRILTDFRRTLGDTDFNLTRLEDLSRDLKTLSGGEDDLLGEDTFKTLRETLNHLRGIIPDLMDNPE